MPDCLGIDTSNYTTSAALYCKQGILQRKKLLPVREGALGLRQSDAVFHHVQQLPELVEALLKESDGCIGAVGVSSRPRDQAGSYMPCFTVGTGVARSLAAALKIPLFYFSHQAGHIAAALYSAGCMEWVERPFLAFHVSGGTTEAVRVTPDPEGILRADIAATSLDLKAGQAIDRVGGLLGLPFPSGRAMEALALASKAEFRPRASMKGGNCSLSGVQNQCEKLLREGAPKEDVALYCLLSVHAALDAMAASLTEKHPGLPILFAGGVSGCSILRERLSRKYQAKFAEPDFSSDNAAGVALLASLRLNHIMGNE